MKKSLKLTVSATVGTIELFAVFLNNIRVAGGDGRTPVKWSGDVIGPVQLHIDAYGSASARLNVKIDFPGTGDDNEYSLSLDGGVGHFPFELLSSTTKEHKPVARVDADQVGQE